MLLIKKLILILLFFFQIFPANADDKLYEKRLSETNNKIEK